MSAPSPDDCPLDSEEARAWPARASTVLNPASRGHFFVPLLGTRRNESHYGSRKAELDGKNPMSKPAEDFEEFARDCVRLAEQADTPALREKLLGLAREWMQAVMDVEDAEARTGK